MMDINVELLHWLINFLTKILQVVVLKMKICQTKNELKYTNQLLENLKSRKYIHLLKTTFGC